MITLLTAIFALFTTAQGYPSSSYKEPFQDSQGPQPTKELVVEIITIGIALDKFKVNETVEKDLTQFGLKQGYIMGSQLNKTHFEFLKTASLYTDMRGLDVVTKSTSASFRSAQAVLAGIKSLFNGTAAPYTYIDPRTHPQMDKTITPPDIPDFKTGLPKAMDMMKYRNNLDMFDITFSAHDSAVCKNSEDLKWPHIADVTKTLGNSAYIQHLNKSLTQICNHFFVYYDFEMNQDKHLIIYSLMDMAIALQNFYFGQQSLNGLQYNSDLINALWKLIREAKSLYYNTIYQNQKLQKLSTYYFLRMVRNNINDTVSQLTGKIPANSTKEIRRFALYVDDGQTISMFLLRLKSKYSSTGNAAFDCLNKYFTDPVKSSFSHNCAVFPGFSSNIEMILYKGGDGLILNITLDGRPFGTIYPELQNPLDPVRFIEVLSELIEEKVSLEGNWMGLADPSYNFSSQCGFAWNYEVGYFYQRKLIRRWLMVFFISSFVIAGMLIWGIRRSQRSACVRQKKSFLGRSFAGA